MTARPSPYSEYVSGDLSTGRLVLIREDSSQAPCGVLIFQDATLTDNSDLTYDLTFDAS